MAPNYFILFILLHSWAVSQTFAQKKLPKTPQNTTAQIDQTIALAQQNNNQQALADAYLQKARTLGKTKETNEAFLYAKKALAVYQKLPKSEEAQGDVYFFMGRLFHELKAPDSTRMLYAKAIAAYTRDKQPQHKSPLKKQSENKKQEKIANTYVQDGKLLYTKGEYLSSIAIIQKGLKIYQELKSRKLEAEATNFLGSAYYLMRDYEKALETYLKSQQINQQVNDERLLLRNHINIGLSYMRLKQDSKALENLRAAERLSIQQKNKGSLAKSRNGIGNVYLNQKQYDKALEFYQSAVNLAREIKSKYILPFSLNGVTRVFVAMQQPDSARKYAAESLTLSHNLGNKNTERDAAEQLALIYEMKKEFAQAYNYHKQFKNLSDSLLDEDKIKRITSLENQFAFEKVKQKQLLKQAQLNSDLQQQKTLNQAFLAGLGLVLALVFYILRSYQIKRRANRELLQKNNLITQQNEEISQQAEELNATNHQLVELGNFKEALMAMIVHDLKNPLNVIIGLSEAEFKPEFQAMINHSGQNMLNMVMDILDVQKFESSEIELHPGPLDLTNLIEMATNDVQILAQEKKLTIKHQFTKTAWVMAEEELMVRVLTNLLTNAIKFSPEGSEIEIVSERINESGKDALAKIWVKDQGMGIPADKLYLVFAKFSQVSQKKSGRVRSTGLGLTFCKLAVEAHGGDIDVESTEGEGTAFWFTLPLAPKQPNKQATTQSNAQNNDAVIAAHTVQFDFTEEERTLLQPIINELSHYEFFEFSKIKEALARLDNFESDRIQALKNQLNSAFLAMNENTFQQLVEDFSQQATIDRPQT